MTSALPLYAGFWRRAGALLIDALILTLPSLKYQFMAGDQAGIWRDFAIWILVDGLYYAGFHASKWQATPGKRVFGIKVTDLRGMRISFVRALGRYLASWLSALLLGIGYLMASWTRRRQALHDKIVATLVVNAGVPAEHVPAGGGVMPLSRRTAVAIAVLALTNVGVTWVTASMPPFIDTEASRGKPIKSAEPGREERLGYVIYTFPFFGGGQQLVAEGTRVYRHADVLETREAGDVPYKRKVLRVAADYDLEAMVVPEARVEGFGLSIARDGGGFSWEWFDRESGDVFRKLQGAGRVRARFAMVDGKEELVEVTFLDDITLRLDRYWLVPFHEGKSDHLIVKKGSVLWLGD